MFSQTQPAVGAPGGQDPPELQTTVMKETDGFVLTQWGDWTTAQGVIAINDAARVGAHHVTIIVELSQSDRFAHDVAFARTPNPKQGQEFAASQQRLRLAEVAAHARSAGQKVSVLPILFARGLGDRQWITPLDPRRWFENYGACISSLARELEPLGVSELVVASELTMLFLRRRPWLRVIEQVRREFGGHLTVAAVAPQYPFLRIYDALDSIGISAYFPLAFRRRATGSNLAASWRLHQKHLLAVARRHKKPLTFVEVGYPATEVAGCRPWNFDFQHEVADLELQRRCFEAFGEVWSNVEELRSFRVWGLSAPGCSHPLAFEPIGKPAEIALKEIFLCRSRRFP